MESVKDSVFWGVRWLYHKAQGTTTENKRLWRDWKEAVIKYGPPKKEYADSVWAIYKNGVKPEKSGVIKLWSVILFCLLFSGVAPQSIQSAALNSVMLDNPTGVENVKIAYTSDREYLLVEISQREDWWEDLSVGKIKDGNIKWLNISNPPVEQAILSAKFMNLNDVGATFLEVYGLTHAGHGFFHLYEIKNDSLNFLLETEAVDFNPDIRWAPDNYKKYGQRNCGEIYSNGTLASRYQDINGDGKSDVILSGVQAIICEADDSHEAIDEPKALIPVEKKFVL